MPEIQPIIPESTITIQANTQTPSGRLRQGLERKVEPEVAEPPKADSPAAPTEPKDDRLLRARLIQEKLRRQLDAEKKQIADERRKLDIEKAGSRKWQEAAELAQSGRYIEAAEKAGLTYDQLTQQILNGGQVPPARIAEQTANDLVEKRLQDFEKRQEEKQKAVAQGQYTQTLGQIEADVKHLVDGSENFPLVKAAESYQDVVKYIESEFHRTGRFIRIEDAIKKVETDALEGLEELLKLEPVRSKVYKQEPTKPPKEQVPNTLSQRNTAPTPRPPGLSDAERKQRAVDAFYGRLP